MSILKFEGFIKNISYDAKLTPNNFTEYDISKFDINSADCFGIIRLSKKDTLAYSKWVSPKRTRSYPFERIYNTYNMNSKIVTVIPIIKDEGNDTGNNDRINFITFSWMNLLNVFIILSWLCRFRAFRTEEG